jgi:hypothetical protein
LAHVYVGVLHGDEQCRERFASAYVRKTKRGGGSHAWGVIVSQRALERSDDVFTRIVRMSHEITHGTFTHGWLTRRHITKRCSESPR